MRECKILMPLLKILPFALKNRCAEMELSYRESAKKCKINYYHFLKIVHGRANPRLDTLEKICYGLEISPNELLGITITTIHSFRVPMSVTKCISTSHAGHLTCFPVCPQCEISLEREYQKYCDRCGQRLSWRNYDKAQLFQANDTQNKHS